MCAQFNLRDTFRVKGDPELPLSRWSIVVPIPFYSLFKRFNFSAD